MAWNVSLSSVWRGMRAMTKDRLAVNYAVRWIPRLGRGWWVIAWTPTWHRGRGPYVSVGLGLIAFHRGY